MRILARQITRSYIRVLYNRSMSIEAKEAAIKAREITLKNKKKVSISMDTLVAHAGIENVHNAPMAPPIHMATTYTRPVDGEYLEHDSIYIRHDNPTRVLLEDCIAKLECHGKEIPSGETPVSCAFASGMMAVTGIVLAHKVPLILLPNDTYHGVPTVLTDVFTRFGVTTMKVDMRNLDNLDRKLKEIPEDRDIILWMESPSNPQCQIIDIQAVCDLVQSRPNITTVVDSTLAPPPVQQPLLLGADLVLQSATKYLAGHSDALIGVVTTSPWTKRGRDLGSVLRKVQIATGGVASSMDSWLTLRGIRTLQVRVAQQCKTAQKVATFLEGHDFVEKVHYPGLTNDKGYDVASKQMKDGLFGGILSIELSSEPAAMAFAAALQSIQRATSLGGTETLIEHRASIEPEGRVVSPPGLLRISIGLEDADDLIDDLSTALDIARQVMGQE